MDQIININTRDKKTLTIKKNDLIKLDDFFLKNLITDIEDKSECINIDINEDYDIIKCIYDSLRYNTLINNKDTNLKLMYMVADKWCVSLELLEEIKNKIFLNKKHLDLCSLYEKIKGETAVCKICLKGFNKNKNTFDSCKSHGHSSPNTNTNIFGCCNKEESCKVGYHVEKIDYDLLRILTNL